MARVNSMPDKKQHFIYWGLNALLFFALYLIQYNGAFSISISHANPMLPLCMVICVSMFSGEVSSVLFGLFAGVLTDGVSSTPLCFNTLLMMLLALGVSLSVRYLVNNNLRSAVILGVCVSLIYYLVRWIFVVFTAQIGSEVKYILGYVFPSVIYSAVIVIPLYLLEKHITKKFYSR